MEGVGGIETSRLSSIALNNALHNNKPPSISWFLWTLDVYCLNYLCILKSYKHAQFEHTHREYIKLDKGKLREWERKTDDDEWAREKNSTLLL